MTSTMTRLPIRRIPTTTALQTMRRALATSFLVLSAGAIASASPAAASAQDNKDSVQLKSGTSETGKIKSEDYGGLVIDNKGDKTIAWKDIAQPGGIHYANAPQYDAAKDQFDGGKLDEAQKSFEELKGEKNLRPVLKQHALYHLAVIDQRTGKLDEALAGYKELLTAFPKSRYLYQVGENYVSLYGAKRDPAAASKALDQLSTDAMTAGVESGFGSAVNVLKGRLLEDQKKYAEAQAAYTVAEKATGVEASVVQQAILGQGRCAVALKDNVKAEGLFRKLTTSPDASAPVLAGAWNGLGDIMIEDARKAGKPDQDKITDALYCYMRGVVLYVPLPGESTAEYERAQYFSAKCFEYLGSLATKADIKQQYAGAKEVRLAQLRKQFPNSIYLQEGGQRPVDPPKVVEPPKPESPPAPQPRNP
jgi:tetratricopeptide (TPR) repeat protein